MNNVILFFNVLSMILLLKFVANEPVIEPLELVLNSTGSEGSFHCNGGVNLQSQANKLTATIENLNMSAPKFNFKIEQTNATTIRIRIKPNGYIGVNRISCYWSNNLTFGHTVDLIVGDHPGVIQLKESCIAFDRQYVQCIFEAPIIARAFLNGFPQLYEFTELNRQPFESYYRPVPRLVTITPENYLVFQFDPRDRNEIPKQSLMSVNITLRRFGWSYYRFNLKPLHTTNVNFKLRNISPRQFIINIDHNVTGTISPRLCSGHISQIDQDKTWTAVQDIAPTTDLMIPIKRLRSSTEYKVCLKCYYEVDDQSYKEEHCQRTRTSPSVTMYIILGVILSLVVALGIVGSFLYRQGKLKKCVRRSSSLSKSSFTKSAKSSSNHSSSYPGYVQDPTTPDREIDPMLLESDQNQSHSNDFDVLGDGKYTFLDTIMSTMLHGNRVSMDTYDLTEHAST